MAPDFCKGLARGEGRDVRGLLLLVRHLVVALGGGDFDEDLALADMVGGADDALLLHALDEGGGAVVADLQAALDIARRGLLVAQTTATAWS